MRGSALKLRLPVKGIQCASSQAASVREAAGGVGAVRVVMGGAAAGVGVEGMNRFAGLFAARLFLKMAQYRSSLEHPCK